MTIFEHEMNFEMLRFKNNIICVDLLEFLT